MNTITTPARAYAAQIAHKRPPIGQGGRPVAGAVWLLGWHATLYRALTS